MPFKFLMWLLALLAQAAALGCSLYQLVQLTDLEFDHINPHDASRNYNAMVYPACFIEIIFCCVLFMGGNWLLGLPALALALFDIREIWSQGNGKIDVTEIFRMLRQKRATVTKKSVVGMIMFAWTLYRFVEAIVTSLVSHHGKQAAQQVLREAAATLYHK